MRVIGVMSGSSLDGVDVACCEFAERHGSWTWRILVARTVEYDPAEQERLLTAASASAVDLARAHTALGRTIAAACNAMLVEQPADLIASHGHTILHQPAEGFTLQIGCGATIAALTGLPVVNDFRSTDVALGGQGAPLVPVGERHLFPDNDSFLNLGGIANLSVHAGSVIGYDIGPCNQALNRLAREAGTEFDEDGALARSGQVHPGLRERLDALPFYQLTAPRSLGREWFDAHMAPLMDQRDIPLADRSRTVTEHIAGMIGRELDNHGAGTTMITGGGVHNGFLIERIRANTRARVMVPDKAVVDYKEALIFAFLGLLRWRGEPNALASVTGATRDSVGGAIYSPN